jgi:hypothetical protein
MLAARATTTTRATVQTPRAPSAGASRARGVARAALKQSASSLVAHAAVALTVANPALADALAAVDDVPLTKSPAFLGFACVAVCWGIPQTLGTAILSQKEAKGRALLQKRGIDTSDIGQGNWGKVQRRLQENDIDWKNEEA